MDVQLLTRAPLLGPLSATLPAGEYYVGDPCYVFGDALYDALHELIFPADDQSRDGESVHVRVVLADGQSPELVDARTRHGDGVYGLVRHAPKGAETVARLGVDSGGLVVADVRLVAKCSRDKAHRAGCLVQFPEPFQVNVADGDWWLGVPPGVASFTIATS